MLKAETRVFTDHVPIALAEKIDLLDERLKRSLGWIMKQALSSWMEQQQARNRLTDPRGPGRRRRPPRD